MPVFKNFILILFIILSVNIILADDLIVLKKVYNESADSVRNYRVHIEYPQIAGMTDKNVQEKINSDISDFFKAGINDFKNNVYNLNLPEPGKDTQSWCDYYYEIYNLQDIFSFSFNIYEYYTDKKETEIKCKSFNFDIKTGNVVSFESLFLKDSDYLKKLSSVVKKNLKEWEAEDPDENELDEKLMKKGIAPVNENFQIFNIKQEGIYFTFLPNQVAQYSQGLIHAMVTFDKLKKILKK